MVELKPCPQLQLFKQFLIKHMEVSYLVVIKFADYEVIYLLLNLLTIKWFICYEICWLLSNLFVI